ncbi:hypothetical protein JXQ70_09560 [bacterium]|nr:hypothetical protein [bacterium]
MKNVAIANTLAFIFLSVSVAHAEYWAQATFIKGEVTVSPGGNGMAVPLTLGAMLKAGDVVTIAEKGRASFLVHDGSILIGKSGQSISFGPQEGEPEVRINEVVRNIVHSIIEVDDQDPMLKHVGGLRSLQNNVAMVPTNTNLRADQTAVFMWLPRPPVSTYTLVIIGENDFYQEYSSADKTVYRLAPGTLEPGRKYNWEVHDGAQDVAIIPLGSGSFSVATREVCDTVKTMSGDIARAYSNSKDTSDATPSFILYQLYLKHGFTIEALLIAEAMCLRDPENSHFKQLKQDLQKRMNLHDSDIVLLKKEYQVPQFQPE